MTAAALGSRLGELSIVAVWRTLGGGPLRANRGRAWWRDGDGFNVSINADKGMFFDHARGVGGGVLALVETVLGGRKEALAWLEDNFGIVSNRTDEDRRHYAANIERARLASAAIAGRRDDYLLDLSTTSGILLAEYHRLFRVADENRDIEVLAKAEEVWDLLETVATRRDRLNAASGPELVRFFSEF